VDDTNAAAIADHWPSPPRATDACGARRDRLAPTSTAGR